VANEVQNGKQAYAASELLDDLYKAIFAKTRLNSPLSVMEMATQKGFIDALIVAADRNEVSKEKKTLNDNPTGFSSNLIFSGPQRVSEAISIKRGILLRIEQLLKTKVATAEQSSRYHYQDMLLRIDKSLR